MDRELKIKCTIAKRTQVEMMSFRNYDTSKEDEVFKMMDQDPMRSEEIFLSYYKEINPGNFNSIYLHKDDNEKKALVYYTFDTPEIPRKKIGEIIKDLLWLIEKYLPKVIIVITMENIYEKLISNLESIKDDVFIQNFTLEQLIINPFKHLNTPKMRKLSEEEIKEKIESFHLPKNYLTSFLILKSSDPVVKFAGWRKGDLILIERMNYQYDTVNIFENNYRVVI